MTTFLPAARALAPGVRLGAWPALVGGGALVALTMQGLLAAHRHLPVGRLFLISLLASLTGLAGAKVYFLVTHRGGQGGVLRPGMSVQGFVIAALTVLVLGTWWTGVPVRPVLDITTPGLLLGMTIGRLGCFFGGCCAGRPTASRWGIWSSDRRVGVRRIPVQLLESSVAAVVATATLLATLFLDPAVDGVILVAGLAAYIGGRQLLFPLRGIPRKTTWGRQTTLVGATALLIGAMAALLGAPSL